MTDRDQKRTAALIVTDTGFLVPSLVLVRQLLDFGIDRIADILVYLIDVDEATISRLDAAFQGQAVTFIPFQERGFVPASMERFHKNHVPVTSLARLSLGPYVPERYDDLVYLDGDIQAFRDPTPLFELSVPDGHIGAGRDGTWLDVAEGRPTYENMDDLGLDPERNFNAGVLAVRRETWIEKGREALDFFLAHPERCKVHDQSALNVVFAGKLVELSPAYNFHHMYAEADLFDVVKPRLVHFTGHRKPWSGHPFPWRAARRAPYVRLLRDMPFLRPYIQISRRVSPEAIRARLRAIARGFGWRKGEHAARRANVKRLMARRPFYLS